MNNKQLDMVLGYLNEGTEIDEFEFMIESFIESCKMFDFVNEETETKKGIIDKILDFLKKVAKFIKDSLLKFLQFIKRKITESKAAIARLTGKKNYNFLSLRYDKIRSIMNKIEKDEYIDKKEMESAAFYETEIVATGKDFVKKYNKEIDNYTVLAKDLEKLSLKLAKELDNNAKKWKAIAIATGRFADAMFGGESLEEKGKWLDFLYRGINEILKCTTFVINANSKILKAVLKSTGQMVEIEVINVDI